MRTIKNIFVHCTATPQHITPEQLLSAFRRRGWTAPGYHYVIRANGNIVKLLDDLFVANGVAGHNKHAVHVAYIGGIDAQGRAVDNRTPEQRNALRTQLRVLLTHYPGARILGHRDISPDRNANGRVDACERIKACPCFDAAEEYADLRPVRQEAA